MLNFLNMVISQVKVHQTPLPEGPRVLDTSDQEVASLEITIIVPSLCLFLFTKLHGTLGRQNEVGLGPTRAYSLLSPPSKGLLVVTGEVAI